MPEVIVTAEVENPSVWEERFRTHGDIFKQYTVKKPVRFSLGEGNRIAVSFEPEDVDTLMKSMKSEVTTKAMASDGVKRDSVRIFVLDKSVKI